MSLVNEALKKARLDAARPAAARRGLPPPGSQPVPASPLAPSIAIKGAAVALLVAVALLIFWAGRRSSGGEETADTSVAQLQRESRVPEASVGAGESPETASDSTTRVAADNVEGALETQSQAAEEPPPAAPGPSREDPAAQARPAAAVVEAPAPTTTPRADQSAGATPEPPAPATPEPRRRPRAELTPPATAQPSSSSASAEPQSFVRKLELPGSRPIELGGIAWSEDRPFALINGRVVGPGDQIEELMVVSVHPKHVELRGDQGYFLIRLK